MKCQYKESIIKEARVRGTMSITSLDVTYKEFFKIFARRGVILWGPLAPQRALGRESGIPGIK